jgi:hypothetical protein
MENDKAETVSGPFFVCFQLPFPVTCFKNEYYIFLSFMILSIFN